MMDISRFKEIKKVLWIILFANLLVALAKIFLGIFIKSASVLSDGFHSLSDASSNVVGIIGTGLAAKPKDDDHPYGHHKFETLTSLLIVAMLFYIALKLIYSSILKFANPVSPEISQLTFIIMVSTLLVNILVANYEQKKGQELKSMILTADSAHTRSDVFISLGVIATLAALKLGAPVIIDPIASILVSLLVLHAAWRIYKEASGVLLDSAMVDESLVRELVMAQAGVLGVHKIRSRGSMDIIHIDMHVEANPQMSLKAAHDLADQIEDCLRNEFETLLDLTVHMEPWDDKIEQKK